MNNHPGCEDCKGLRAAWYTTLSEFSESVSRMRDARKSGEGYMKAHCETALAQVTADNARTMLDLHRSVHVYFATRPT
jgi:hypothetical protein